MWLAILLYHTTLVFVNITCIIECMEEINKLITDKNFEVAKVKLKNILDQDEKNLEALKLLGLCYVNLEQFEEGKNIYETVVKYFPDDASSWFYLANCYDNLEDFLHAKTAYKEVIKLCMI